MWLNTWVWLGRHLTRARRPVEQSPCPWTNCPRRSIRPLQVLGRHGVVGDAIHGSHLLGGTHPHPVLGWLYVAIQLVERQYVDVALFELDMRNRLNPGAIGAAVPSPRADEGLPSALRQP
jgi:hypothetical protein